MIFQGWVLLSRHLKRTFLFGYGTFAVTPLYRGIGSVHPVSTTGQELTVGVPLRNVGRKGVCKTQRSRCDGLFLSLGANIARGFMGMRRYLISSRRQRVLWWKQDRGLGGPARCFCFWLGQMNQLSRSSRTPTLYRAGGPWFAWGHGITGMATRRSCVHWLRGAVSLSQVPSENLRSGLSCSGR